MTLGAGLLLFVGVFYSYGACERYRFLQGWATAGGRRPIDRDISATAIGDSTVSDETNRGAALPQKDIDPPAALPAPPSPTPVKPAPATWIRIAKIDVDSPVVHAPIANGEWQVPKFVVGHLEGTAEPVLTLLTCTDQWTQAARDYSERLVVVAKPDS